MLYIRSSRIRSGSNQEQLMREAEAKFDTLKKEYELKIDTERSDLRDREKRIQEIEEKIIAKEERIEKKFEDLEGKSESLSQKQIQLDTEIARQMSISDSLRSELSSIAKLTENEAKQLLLDRTEERYDKDILALMDKKRAELKVKESETAREILIKSIQQYAGDVTAETTQTIIHLESDDIKGKLIGKE